MQIIDFMSLYYGLLAYSGKHFIQFTVRLKHDDWVISLLSENTYEPSSGLLGWFPSNDNLLPPDTQDFISQKVIWMCLLYHNTKIMNWNAHSPEVNSCENDWDLLSRNLSEHKKVFIPLNASRFVIFDKMQKIQVGNTGYIIKTVPGRHIATITKTITGFLNWVSALLIYPK